MLCLQHKAVGMTCEERLMMSRVRYDYECGQGMRIKYIEHTEYSIFTFRLINRAICWLCVYVSMCLWYFVTIQLRSYSCMDIFFKRRCENVN